MRVSLLANFPLHVLPGYEARKPGGHFATWLPQLSEGFAQGTEFDIHWVVMSKEPMPEAPIRWRNQTFHYLHNAQRLRMLRGYRRDCQLIHHRLASIEPDLVHAWGTEDCYGLAGASCGRPWLLSMQGILQEYVRRARMHPLVYIQAWYEARVLRKAREITVESHWGEKVIHRLAPLARTHLVEYGVQPAFFLHQWEPDRQRPHAVFIGTPDERKGVQDAVAAFAHSSLQDQSLDIIGDTETPFVRKLRARSTSNVHWRGRLSPAETAEALRRAWCLVLPTRADTSPNVVKEARVIGLPVITTPHGGQSDYIKDGVNGFVVKPKDNKTLAARLVQILCDANLTRALGKAQHEEQRMFFQPQRTAELLLALYKRLLSLA